MKGDRNVIETTGLQAFCPKCNRIVRTVQTVDNHKDYGLIKHWCPTHNKILKSEPYRFMNTKTLEKRAKWI